MRQKVVKILFALANKIRSRRNWKMACTPVKQLVVETDKGVFVDGKIIKYVIKDSVTTEPFGRGAIVTLSFFASEFLKY